MKKLFLFTTQRFLLLFSFVLFQQTAFAKPVLDGVPDNVTVSCDAIPDAPEVTATDDCAGTITIILSENIVPINNGCENSYNLKRIWTATNDCGEQTVGTQTIKVRDNDKPVLVGVPERITVECDAIPPPAVVTATDNCDSDVEIILEETEIPTDDDCEDSYNIKRKWTATDNCGNSISKTQTIRVRDNTKPVLVGVPERITVECDAIPAPAVVTATDNCDSDLEVTLEEIEILTNDDCEDSYNIKRKWTATDNCGNSISKSQIVKVRDNTKPVLVGVPEKITVSCDAIPEPAVVTATDNCDTDVSVTLEEIIVPINGGCENSYNLRRKWTATDNCGNSISKAQVIKIRDNTKPVFAALPATLTVDCNTIPEPTEVSVTDNCDDDLTLTFEEVRTDGACSDAYTLTRTWTAEDNCGNSAQIAQVLTVIDETKPVLVDFPINVTVECDAIPAAATVTATDNCDTNVAVSMEETEIPTDDDCENSYNLKRKWTATDNCGNSVSQTQTIKVRDNTKPVLVGVPQENITVECDAIPTPAAVTATDNCDTDVEVILEQIEIPTDDDCDASYNLKRKWTATDNCGNTVSASYILRVRDNTNPVLVGVPQENITVECDAIPLPATVTATDNCDTDVEVILEEIETLTDDGCDASYNLKRKWTATDDCGNSVSASYTIRVRDNTNPVLVGVPLENITVECNAIPTPATVTATDICDTDVTVNLEESIVQIAEGCENSYNLKRKWTATDDCGNTVSATHTVRVRDNTNPVLADLPADVTVDCGAIPNAATPTATDNCDNQVDIFFKEEKTDETCTGNYTLTRTWTAIDNCGNSDMGVQVITVEDTTPPDLSETPSNITVECNAIPNAPTLTATDDCSSDLVVTFTESDPVLVDPNNDCLVIITRTWTVSDDCGNTTTHSQIITIEDTTAPVMVVPADVTVACGDIPAEPIIEATDNCNLAPVVFSETSSPKACDGSYTITRTWVADDRCGNVTTKSQMITVQNTNPSILSDAPADVTVECGNVPVAAVLVAADNCTTDVEVNATEVRTDGSCAGNYTLTRTWTYTNDCGITDSKTQVITVEDTTPPVLDCPANTPSGGEILCTNFSKDTSAIGYLGKSTTANINRLLACATDNCGTVSVTVDYDLDNLIVECGKAGILEITYTVSDACGNTTTITSQLRYIDNAAPELSDYPADITVDCDNVPAMEDLSASDICSPEDFVITKNEVRTDGSCPNTYILIRTWSVEDDCGNNNTHTQTVTVEDTTPPVLSTVPANVTVECDVVPVAAILTATDNCTQDITPLYNEVRTDGNCTDNYILTRTWTATDACGNETIGTQEITVQNTAASILSDASADITVDCNNVPVAAILTAADNCTTDVEVNATEVRTDGDCPGNYTLTRTWLWANDCGTTDTKSQVITVQDTTPPTLDCAPNTLNLRCIGDLTNTNFGASWNSTNITNLTACASDDCSDVTVTSDFDINNIVLSCGNAGTLETVFTISDACGNATTIIGKIIVIDETAPELSAQPADITVECDNVPAMENLTATDACVTDLVVTKNEVRTDGDCPNSYTLTRTWSVSDPCGNTTSHTQTVTVVDTTLPVLMAAPADITLAACSPVPPPAILTATNNCETDLVARHTDVNIPGACADSYSINRTWTVSDACGNVATAGQTITFEDEDKEILTGVPADVTVSCDNIPPAPIVVAADNCNTDVNVLPREAIIAGNCPGNYIITRTWVYTDDCGNSEIKTQTITVQDTEAPVLSATPANVTVECDAIPTVPTITATDNCNSDLTVEFNETDPVFVDLDSDCLLNFTRTWTVSDGCGNTTTHTQVITLEDTTAPTLDVPADVTVSCGDIPAEPFIVANDNCQLVPIAFSETSIPGTCDGSFSITRTWVADDGCGNVTTKSQVITVEDTTPPVLSATPADITLATCSPRPPVAVLTASDNCSSNLTVTSNDVKTDGACADNYVVTRTWIVSDDCGNEATATQIITFADTDKEVLSEAPADVTVSCDNIPTAAVLIASDNCNSDVNVVATEVITDGDCPGNYTITRTWLWTDDCGNTESKDQVITVEDTTPPTLKTAPADASVECDAVPDAAILTATDNCDTDIAVVFSEAITFGDDTCADNYTITRTWTATDDCGNITTHTQIILVEDSTNPVLTGVPDDITVDCNAIPISESPTATDNCDTDVAITFNEVSSDIACTNGTIITRTWIATDNCGNQTQDSQVITIENTTAPFLNYCETNGRNTNYFWIRHVVLGTINHPTGNDGGYADYTNLSTNITAGSEQIITLSPGYSRFLYNVHWKVWIDYNRDGDFEDENEALFTYMDYKILKIKFGIPNYFVAGETRMRVSMKYGRPAGSCESFSYGEVEDYTVNLVNPSNGLATASSRTLTKPQIIERVDNGSNQPLRELSLGMTPQLAIFPNPVQHRLNVSLTNYQEAAAEVRIYNNLGQIVYQNQLENSSAEYFSIEVQGLEDGLYFLSVSRGNAPPLVQKFYKD